MVVAVDAVSEPALEVGSAERAETKLLTTEEKLLTEFEGMGTGTKTEIVALVALEAGLGALVVKEDTTLAASELGGAAALDPERTETKLLA